MSPSPCPTCLRLRRQAEALGEKGGPPTCPECGAPLFTSALKRRAVALVPVVEVPIEVTAQVVYRVKDLDRPKPTVAEFLRRIADDLDAHRASTIGTDFKFERIRVMGPGYDLLFGRYDPERDHPWRRRK